MAAPECDRFGADLSAYLDGELPDERVRQVERHMLGCDACRQAFEQIREVAGELADLPRRRAPDGLAAAMRRAAERRVLLETPERAPPRGATVWRLYARLSAAAALIVVCVFAGWYAHDRVRPRSIPSVGDDRRLTADKQSSAGKDFARAGGRAGAAEGVAVERLDVPEPREPVVALGDRPVRARGEFLTEGGRHLGALQPSTLVGRGPTDEEKAPTIEIYVTPQTPTQYSAVLGALVALQEPTDDAALRADIGADEVRLWQSTDTAGSAGFRFSRLSAAEANGIIEQLEQRAPQQVYGRYSDIQRVQQAGVPVSPTETDSDEPARTAGVPFVGGQSGRRGVAVDEKALESVANDLRELPEDKGGKVIVGRGRVTQEKSGRMGERRRTESETPPKAPLSRARGGRGGREPVPAVEHADTVPSHPATAPTDMVVQQKKADPIARTVQIGTQVRDRMIQLWQQLQAPAAQPPAEGRVTLPQMMTLRVRVFPPPQVQTSRPAETP